jgi:hypothetical protein
MLLLLFDGDELQILELLIEESKDNPDHAANEASPFKVVCSLSNSVHAVKKGPRDGQLNWLVPKLFSSLSPTKLRNCTAETEKLELSTNQHANHRTAGQQNKISLSFLS